MTSQVLIVRHGPGLGRMDRYLQPAFDYLCQSEPALWSRIRIYETGNPSPSLQSIVAVVFLMADPLRELYPDCYEQALLLAEQARQSGIRILNSPVCLSNSVKSTQSRLWRSAGIPTPEYHRFESPEELHQLANKLAFPLLIRSDEEHHLSGLRICRTHKALNRIDAGSLKLPGAVGSLLDVRSGYQGFESYDPRAHYYHKKRLLVMGDVVRTKHVMFAGEPIVSSKTSIFSRYPRWCPWLQHFAVIHPGHRACIEADLNYWRRGSEHAELMHQAVRALGLDFAAIDYSDMGSGNIILWEANPHPHIPALEEIKLPKLRHARLRMTSYYQAIGRFLAGLLKSDGSPA